MCIDFNHVEIASGRISLLYCYCILLSSQSIFVYLLRLSLSIRVKFIGAVLIQPLGACMFSSIPEVLRQPLGIWVYIYIDSHLAYEFYNFRNPNVTGRIQ